MTLLPLSLLVVTVTLLALVIRQCVQRNRRRAEAFRQIKCEALFLRPLMDREFVLSLDRFCAGDWQGHQAAVKRFQILERRWKREITDKLKSTTP